MTGLQSWGSATRFQDITFALGLAQQLESAASHDMQGRIIDPAGRNLPWMPFNLFDFAGLLLESVPLIPDTARFLDVGAGPGSKMIVARDVFGLDVAGFEILDVLAVIGRAAGVPVQTADADDWAGYENHDVIWLNRPMRDREAERFLEQRIWREMAPGAVIICVNTETRPPQSWIIINDSWDDLRRGAWVKPYTSDEGGG